MCPSWVGIRIRFLRHLEFQFFCLHVWLKWVWSCELFCYLINLLEYSIACIGFDWRWKASNSEFCRWGRQVFTSSIKFYRVIHVWTSSWEWKDESFEGLIWCLWLLAGVFFVPLLVVVLDWLVWRTLKIIIMRVTLHLALCVVESIQHPGCSAFTYPKHTVLSFRPKLHAVIPWYFLFLVFSVFPIDMSCFFLTFPAAKLGSNLNLHWQYFITT